MIVRFIFFLYNGLISVCQIVAILHWTCYTKSSSTVKMAAFQQFFLHYQHLRCLPPMSISVHLCVTLRMVLLRFFGWNCSIIVRWLSYLVHRITGMLELREIQKNAKMVVLVYGMNFGSIVSLKMHMVAYSNLMRIK